MADKPATLLERLNHVLENLAIRLGSGPPGSAPVPGGGSSTQPGPQASFLDPIKRLLERIAQAAEKLLGASKAGQGGAGGEAVPTPRGGTLTEQMTARSSKPQQPVWEAKTTPHAGPQPPVQDPNATADEWYPASDFDQAIADLGKPDPDSPTAKAVGQMTPKNFQAFFAQSGGAMAGGAGIAESATAAVGGAEAAAGGPAGLALAAALKQMDKGIKFIGDVNHAMADAARSEGAGEAAGKLIGGGGKAVGDMIGGPVGELVSKFATVGEAVVGATDQLRNFDREILNASFRFSEFSSAMSAVEAQQEIRDIQLGMRKGDTQASSANKLAEAMSDLNDALLPYDNAWAQFRNQVLAALTSTAAQTVTTASNSAYLRILTTHVKWVAEWLGAKFEDDDDKLTDVNKRLWTAGDKFARPERFPE